MTEILKKRSVAYAGAAAIVALFVDRYIALSSELSRTQRLLARYAENGEPLADILDADADASFLSTLVRYAVPLSMLGATVYLIYAFFRDVQQTRHEFSFRHISLSSVMLYKIDTFLSSSVLAKTYIFLVFVLMLITVGGLLFAAVTGDSVSSSFWQVWLLIVDAGAHGDFDGTARRVVGLVLSCFGLIVFTLLIGITSELLAEKINQLNEGRSRVLEANHTLILGWSDKTLPIIAELAIANESMGGGVIVVLCDEPKQDVERRIEAAEVSMRGSRVVVRPGSPLLASDLRKVGAEHARAIIVLSADGDVEPDEADALTLRAVLSLVNMPLRGHVVAELRDVDNRDILQIVGGSKVEVIVAHDIIGRIMLLASMQPGLALVLDKLLGFDGAEFYLSEWPDTVGLTFREAFFLFPEAVLVGIAPKAQVEENDPENANNTGKNTNPSLNLKFQKNIQNSQPKLWLNPPPDTIIQPGDKLICLADDDDSYAPSAPRLSPAERYLKRAQRAIQRRNLRGHTMERLPSHTLFIGYRRDVDDMIRELDSYAAPGSTLTLLNEVDVERRLKLLADGGLDLSTLQNLAIHHIVGSPLARRTYETGDWGRAGISGAGVLGSDAGGRGGKAGANGSGGCLLTRFDSVLILADETYECNMQNMDSRSLTTLLLVRDINAKHEQRLIQEHVANVQRERLRRGSVQGSPVPPSESISHSESENKNSGLTGAAFFYGNESPVPPSLGPGETVDDHADLLVADWSNKITISRRHSLHAQIRNLALAGRLPETPTISDMSDSSAQGSLMPSLSRGGGSHMSSQSNISTEAGMLRVSVPEIATDKEVTRFSSPPQTPDYSQIKIIGDDCGRPYVPAPVVSVALKALSAMAEVEEEDEDEVDEEDKQEHKDEGENNDEEQLLDDEHKEVESNGVGRVTRRETEAAGGQLNTNAQLNTNTQIGIAGLSLTVIGKETPTKGVRIPDNSETLALARSASDLIVPPSAFSPRRKAAQDSIASPLSDARSPLTSPGLCVPGSISDAPPNVVELVRAQSQLTVIAEVLDSRTKTLVSQATSSHYVASNELVSKAIAMVAEDKAVGTILQELLTAEGSETYVRPAGYLVCEGEVASVWDVSARALSLPKPEIVIGYIKNMSGHARRLKSALAILGRDDLAADVSDDEADLQAHAGDDVDEDDVDNDDHSWMSHVVLNPQRKEDLILWSERDFFVVIAQD